MLELMRGVLARGASFRFQAKGSSMTPFILDGDLITVVPLQNSSPKTGDVVAFMSPKDERLIVHRIVAREKKGFIIMGDGVGSKDIMSVTKDHILGRVKKIERNNHQVKVGLGPERVIIAWFSKKGSLYKIYQWIAANKRKIIGRLSHS
jgi:signal peptidase I